MITMVEIASTMMVAGAACLQYLPQVIIKPFFAATEVPTTFAEAPMGVAQPPMSVPIARLHARVLMGIAPPAGASA